MNLERVHFLGNVPYATYKKVLQVSAVHVYLTYPFVLSWSLLEAMASGCLIVGSDTAPVKEVIKDGENGLLVDFFNASDVSERVLDSLDHSELFEGIRREACGDARSYALDKGVVEYVRQLNLSAERRLYEVKLC
ncbi:Glycosyl transferases group 1 [compost metagenome]